MPDAPVYRVGPQPGGPLYVPDVLNNREGPQAREPSKCLNGQSYGERLAKEAFWLPAIRGSKKDSDRAITPAVEVVCVPAHLVPPGSLQTKQLCHLHAQLSLGQSCHRQKKKSFVYACRITSVTSTLCNPVDCGLPGFSVREGGSPGRNTGAYWPILVAIPFRTLYFLWT